MVYSFRSASRSIPDRSQASASPPAPAAGRVLACACFPFALPRSLGFRRVFAREPQHSFRVIRREPRRAILRPHELVTLERFIREVACLEPESLPHGRLDRLAYAPPYRRERAPFRAFSRRVAVRLAV